MRKTFLLPIFLALVLAAIISVKLIRSYASMPVGTDGTLRRVRVPVLMYHYISVPPPDSDIYREDLSVTPENFRRQMKWLKDHDFTTITPEAFIDALILGRPLPERPILLTFDDGYEDAYTMAFPILKEFGFVGTFFIVTDWLDERRRGYMTWDNAREMSDAGMSIQSHSRMHYDMRDRDHDWLVYHAAATSDIIEANIGIRPLIFCYPSGKFDLRVVRELRAAGFLIAFTTLDGTYATTDNMLRLPRVRMRGSTSLADFAYLVTWER
jgi:peptidoglycan/xylan/chitin deacetylase (PgdA/CDA1 family)